MNETREAVRRVLDKLTEPGTRTLDGVTDELMVVVERAIADRTGHLNALLDFERAARHSTDLKLGEVLGRKQ